MGEAAPLITGSIPSYEAVVLGSYPAPTAPIFKDTTQSRIEVSDWGDKTRIHEPISDAERYGPFGPVTGMIPIIACTPYMSVPATLAVAASVPLDEAMAAASFMARGEVAAHTGSIPADTAMYGPVGGDPCDTYHGAVHGHRSDGAHHRFMAQRC